MRRTRMLGMLCTAGLMWGSVWAQDEKKPEKQPRVEVVFVLDTTGSMGGLIDGAKKKIWSIATEIAKGKPTPEVSVGLVAYRDQGDKYVTKVFDLTNNLDKMYEELMSYQADGGGDGPEHVNKALHDAVNSIHWSKNNKGILQIVFLVGDAPPHMDYQDGHDYRKIVPDAAKKGLIFNTVQCGTHSETASIWKEIAHNGEGQYVQIDQSGGMVAIATPYDKELAELNGKYSKTFVGYGAEGEKKGKDIEKADAALDAAKPAAASKAEYQARQSGKYFGEADLLNAIKDKRVRVADLKKEELPEELRKMSEDELKSHLDKKAKEREEVQKNILELSQKRDEYTKAELKKLSKGNAFDAQVLKMLQEQGAKKGIKYE